MINVLKLTSFDGNIHSINMDNANHWMYYQVIRPNDCTIIFFNEGYLCVRETPEEINTKIAKGQFEL